jgi:hypothetical protein
MPTNRELFMKKYNIPPNTPLGLDDIAKITKIPISILSEVMERGKGAWLSNIRSVRIKGSFKKDPDLRKFPRSARLTPEQWGYARVYSFVMKGKTWHTADQDLARKVESNNRE